ncbi:hypothetical protein [Bradymonas sediminis]|uniref:Uncharacterized protein n=1 Tax=Bradymonas sediminis TaxID=1548548 RepID=A0A2Z4FLR0_9DELT|nr:hypothetical protein [Bradymonas sediminis]AWV89891.1 hypothetical protein DN745_11295 [Bradymonas sediminis]TDP61991.1 hypothetical protein DFR33_1157 [Bradymonas sediminis]
MALDAIQSVERAKKEEKKTPAERSVRPPRHGFERDERGRLYQTHFDLRRRAFYGVYDWISASRDLGSFEHRLAGEFGGVWETYDDQDKHRHRHQFVQARAGINPTEVHGLLYGYDRGRADAEPTFRLVEFLTPQADRYDLFLNLGTGVRVGRMRYEPNQDNYQLLIDVFQGHLNWEFLQNRDQGLEDYLLLRVGAGVGVALGSERDFDLYAYPEVGLEGAWTIDERGLTQMTMHAAYRHIWEDAGLEHDRAHARVNVERVLFSLNDMPVSAFAEVGVAYRSGPLFDAGALNYQATLGGRISFLSPPRPDYAPQPSTD